MDIFVPDKYYKSIYDINYKELKKIGIKCILLDMDNTLTPVVYQVPNKQMKELVSYLNDLGFKVIIMSNGRKERIEPFKQYLNIDASPMSTKPLKRKYKKIMKFYKYSPSEIAAIGDQLVTDIFGANRMGMTSILVNPISNVDSKISFFNRFLERKIMNSLSKRDLFVKGRYYE